MYGHALEVFDVKVVDPFQERFAAAAKIFDDFAVRLVVVACLLRFGIGHVSGSKFRFAGEEIIDASLVERIQVVQVTDLFLDRPFVVESGN